MSNAIDEAVLDDGAALVAADQGEMLRAVASSGAQVRLATRLAGEAGVARLAEEGRPRALVVAGMGGSGQAGDVLTAVVGVGAAVPVVTLRGPALPGWVGPTDLVVAVSCSGTTAETLLVAEAAGRRGARLLTVGAPGSPLEERSRSARGRHVPVDARGLPPRANLWALAVPVLLAADALGLARVGPATLEATAGVLDETAVRCGPSRELFDNPAKTLALELAGTLPLVWGSGDAGAVAATRFATQLQENAKLPAVPGVLPEAGHNQVVAFDGPFGGAKSSFPPRGGTGPLGEPEDLDDFFRDRVEEPYVPRLQLVLLRDTEEHPLAAARAGALPGLAEERGVGVSQLRAAGNSPLERLASLVAVCDFASVYLALATGIDPTPIAPIEDLKERTAR